MRGVLRYSGYQARSLARARSRSLLAARSLCSQPNCSHDHAHAALVYKHDHVKEHSSKIAALVNHAAEVLPHQGILENFVHHNPLEHFQNMHFDEAAEYVKALESYRSPSERAHALTGVNPSERVKEALVDLSATFLDRGAAKWVPRHRDKGFLHFFAWLEPLGFAPWRGHAKLASRKILSDLKQNGGNSAPIAEAIIKENLLFFGIPEEDWEACIRSMMMQLKGWAGMFRRMETHPSESPYKTKVELLDFAAVQSILVRSSIESLARDFGWDPKRDGPIARWLAPEPTLKALTKGEELSRHTSAMAYVDQVAEHREQLESQFQASLLKSIGSKPISAAEPGYRPQFQLYTCIDDRCCSLRRYVESAAKTPGDIETFGLAGFFGVPIRYQPSDGRDEMILAPEGQNPSAILAEAESHDDIEKAKKLKFRKKLISQLNLFWEKASFSPIGSLLLSTFFPLSLARLVAMGFSPGAKYELKSGIAKNLLPPVRTDFPLPLPADQAAAILARTFKDLGTHDRFAPIIMVLGHGSISVNNPFAAAYNCGACGGRDGGPNARLLARLANNSEVRKHLLQAHNISIPQDTIFVGGMHNTTTDTITLYDLEAIPESHRAKFNEIQAFMDRARGLNALERCQRFLLASHVKTPEQALTLVQQRAFDLAEVRPELNHATNAAVVVGRRDLTKGRFLDRRAFLPSYDPFSDDDQGTNLEHVLAPALIVCSGINLEYLFSTIEVDKLGAGTKVPLNVVGNIAVLQGTTGDLRPGLPTQMTEMHTPIRALYVVDAPASRVEAVLDRRQDLKYLVRNEWIRLIVRDPETNKFYLQSQGDYIPVTSEEIAQGQTSEWGVSFEHHLSHAQAVTKKEDRIYNAAMLGMLTSAAVPLWMLSGDGSNMLNPHALMIVAGGTSLSLPVLAFARRYLHGEFMFGRFATLTVGLLSGFNIVASASSFEQLLAGWSLLGFSSTFLIGAYNDRPTVRNNATFVFGAYQISDLALLTAATFGVANGAGVIEHPEIAAAALIVASIYKSSQFPLTALFARSMEGPTPASALGYAGLSAHSGVILLTSTMPLWFGFDWARLALGGLGLLTAVDATLVSKIRPERKGAIANATSATIGGIYGVLAMGYPDVALMLSFGHAAFRMTQVLRAPNIIQDMATLKSNLGAKAIAPKEVSDFWYGTAWALRRADIDFTLLWLLHKLSRPLQMPKTWKLNKFQQWGLTGAGVVMAGFPFTPCYDAMEHTIMELLPTHPFAAAALMTGYFGLSVGMIRFLFLNVLDKNRFQNIRKQLEGSGKAKQELPGKAESTQKLLNKVV